MGQVLPECNEQKQQSLYWSLPFLLILCAHFVMDAFSQMIPASLGLIQERWQMTDQQGALFLGVGSLCSGLAQPLFAWISDRTGNRIYGGLGLAVAGLMISSMGLATNVLYLFMFYTCGMVGNGMFHPVAASTIGQIDAKRRSRAVSCFFVAGMLGGVVGAKLGTRLLLLPNGFDWLQLAAIPALFLGLFLHWHIRHIDHRTVRLQGTQNTHQHHWSAIILLYFSAAIRFMVNLGLVYLYLRWVEGNIAAAGEGLSPAEISSKAAPTVGDLNASAIAGMAVGGLASGFLIPSGREKLPYILLPLLFAPMVAMIPFSSYSLAYLLAFGVGIGSASMVPVTIAMAQRFLPGRTSLASGLMMGGAWAIAMFGPSLAQFLIDRYSITIAFIGFSILMAGSGMLILPISNDKIKQSVESPNMGF